MTIPADLSAIVCFFLGHKWSYRFRDDMSVASQAICGRCGKMQFFHAVGDE